MTEAWVAGDPSGFWAGSWVYDCGEYLGPGDFDFPPRVPAAAHEIDFVLGFPNPDTDIQHFADGSYTDNLRGKNRVDDHSTGTYGDPYGGTGGRHLYVQWYPTGLPSDLTGTDPDVLPLDLVPVGYVTGARYEGGAFTFAGLRFFVGGPPPLTGSVDFTLGGLTVAADGPSSTPTATATFVLGASVLDLGNPYNGDQTAVSPPTAGTAGGGLVFSATEGRPALALYDTDCRTKLANLGNGRDLVWLDEMSAPGSLSFAVPLTDTVRTLMQPGCFVKVFWRGRARLAARLTGSSTDLAIDGNVWRKWENLPGALDVLNDGIVLPEYGLRTTSGTARNFGPMSHFGAWYDSGHWQNAVGFFYNDDTGFRKGKPAGLKTANPMWISKLGPYVDEEQASTLWFRKTFYTSTPMTYQILAAGDTHLTLYMDGEEIFTPDQQDYHAWRFLATVPGAFEIAAGRHVIAAKLVNSRADHSGSPIAFALAFQQTDTKGDPVKGPALIRTDDHWNVSDQNPGWKPAEIVAGLMYEAHQQDVSVFANLRRGFGLNRDTHGELWEDPGIHVFDITTPIGDVLAQFTESHFDAWIDPETFTLNIYNRKGKDRSATVQFDVGASLKQHTADRVFPRYNSGLLQLRDGTWKIVEDSASIAAVGRAMIGLSLGSTPDSDTAAEVARTQFAETAHSQWSFTSEISLLTGPQPYVHFTTGDTVTVPNESNTDYYKMRVMSITPDFSGETPTCHVEWIRDVDA